MTRDDYRARGAKAYRDGVRWVSTCPYAEGSWRASAWKDGWWDEKERAEATVPFTPCSDNSENPIS